MQGSEAVIKDGGTGMDTAIQTIHLNKTYRLGESTVHALRDFDIEIEPNTFTAIIGKSGSGKSTLLHLMGGLDQPTSGQVFLLGTEISTMKEKALSVFRRKHLGFVFQFFNLVPELTVKENIQFPALLDRQKTDRSYYEKLITTLHLEERQAHFPNQISGGEQQRVAIARALMNQPEVLLLDEPTGNLDEETSGDVLAALKELQRDFKKTLVMVTHDRDIAAAADQVITLRGGRAASGGSL